MPAASHPRGISAGFVALVLLVHGLALYLFTTGFFLTRFEISQWSGCSEIPSNVSSKADLPNQQQSPRAPHEQQSDEDEAASCWMDNKFDRVVLVVIDALRYDFVVPSEELPSSSPPAEATAWYRDHLPILSDMRRQQPDHSLLFKFVADPPTMTMQRLKGLTTGSLPTFLDIKDNMHSSEIVEDNWIRQFASLHKPIVFMGDDTWDSLYAKHFSRKYSFDSFNVKDLHTVDQGVQRHLFEELHQHRDWKVLIAHFLGVDHVGHTFGPRSQFMTDKLQEMNRVLSKLIHEIDESTLLIVLGDHGMSEDGNHGGATDDETGAALFLYSKKKLHQAVKDNKQLSLYDEWHLGERSADPGVVYEVPQVDLVPTLSLLAGVPIPFGNLGAVIPQLFFEPNRHQSLENQHPRTDQARQEEEMMVHRFERLNRVLDLNLHQVRRYLWTYSRASKMPKQQLNSLESIYEQIRSLQSELDATKQSESQKNSLKLLARRAKLIQRFLRQSLELGRSMWTQFDLVQMACGVVLLVISLLFLSGMLWMEDMAKVSWESVIGMLISTSLGALLGWFYPGHFLPSDNFARSSFCAASACLVHAAMMLWLARKRDKPSEVIQSRHFHAINALAFIVVVLHSYGLLSNSYIVVEQQGMAFFSMTMGFVLLALCFYYKASYVEAAGFLLSSKFLQMVPPPNIIHSDTSLLVTWLPLGCLVVIVFFRPLKSSPASCSSPRKLTPWLWLWVLVTMISFVCVASYWTFAPISSSLWRLGLPRVVYGCFLSCLATRIVRLGLAGVEFFDVAVQLFIPVYLLLLGPRSPLTVLCLVVQFECFARLSGKIASNRLVTGSSGRLYGGAFWLLGHLWYQWFFVTGHENVFSSLQNACGFVGLDEFQFVAAGALLALNTFGNYLLAMLLMASFRPRPISSRVLTSSSSASSKPPANTTMWLFSASFADETNRWRCCCSLLLYFALNATVTTIFVAFQRRHLFVWAIFAPKFIFDGATLLIVDGVLLGLIWFKC